MLPKNKKSLVFGPLLFCPSPSPKKKGLLLGPLVTYPKTKCLGFGPSFVAPQKKVSFFGPFVSSSPTPRPAPTQIEKKVLCFGLVDLKANFLPAGWLAGVDD